MIIRIVYVIIMILVCCGGCIICMIGCNSRGRRVRAILITLRMFKQALAVGFLAVGPQHIKCRNVVA